jgi:hypothetical protein
VTFEKWWVSEGSVMQEGGCNAETIASAAWVVAKQPPKCTCWRCMGLDKDPYANEEEG